MRLHTRKLYIALLVVISTGVKASEHTNTHEDEEDIYIKSVMYGAASGMLSEGVHLALSEAISRSSYSNHYISKKQLSFATGAFTSYINSSVFNKYGTRIWKNIDPSINENTLHNSFAIVRTLVTISMHL